MRCRRCTLLYLHPWPAPEETAAVYGDTYFENEAFLTGTNASLFGYTDYIAERFNKQPQYAHIARGIRQLLVPTPRRPRLLEVGCGLGYFLNEAFEEDFDVAGIEFNTRAVERLRRKYAFPILSGALEHVSLEAGAFDCVAMFDVIEHLRDPFGSLDKLYDALAPGGLLVLSTVDAESIVSRLIGKRLEDFRRTREHLVFFGRKTMTDVLSEHGFDVFSIRSIGHTFELSFLLDRLALYNRPLFSWVRRVADALRLGTLQLKVNPFTKMIVTARKRGTRLPGPAPTAADHALSATDRTLIRELETLERTTPRHYEWVFDVIKPHLGTSVLEVGSGIGVMSKFLIPCSPSLVLSDYAPVYLSILKERFGPLPHLRYELLDLTRPPYDLGGLGVDTIVCLNVLEHIEKDTEALAALAALLPRGGRVILQVPNYPRLFGNLDTSYGHFRRYSARSLRGIFERAGLRVRMLRRFNPFSIPGWIVASGVSRNGNLNVSSLRTYNALVPVLRKVDVVSRGAGLSLIACAEKV